MTVEELQERIAVLNESMQQVVANVHSHIGAIEELERWVVHLSTSGRGEEENAEGND